MFAYSLPHPPLRGECIVVTGVGAVMGGDSRCAQLGERSSRLLASMDGETEAQGHSVFRGVYVGLDLSALTSPLRHPG